MQFVTHAEFLRRTEDVSPRALEAAAFTPQQLESLIQQGNRQNIFVQLLPNASTTIAAIEGPDSLNIDFSSESGLIHTGAIGHG